MNNVVAQSESGGNGLWAVLLGMASAGEWTRRVSLDVFAVAMSDYVVGVFLMLALIFPLILLPTDLYRFGTMQRMAITWPVDIVFCRDKRGYC